VIKEVAS